MSSVYLFNPDHDLALANGDANFDTPVFAQQLAHDLATLPLWYADPQSCVHTSENANGWKSELQKELPQLSNISIVQKINTSDELKPWGWNAALHKRFPLVTDEYIRQIRHFSHRSQSTKAMLFLEKNASFATPPPAHPLHNENEITNFCKSHGETVFKAPWSGSGRGIFACLGTPSDNIKGWCLRTIAKQGCVMGEPKYDKKLDFAMEFKMEHGIAQFCGYSLFKTEGMGVYRNNKLCTDTEVETYLSGFIPIKHLNETKRLLELFFMQEIPFYKGFIGVDMLIFQDNGIFRLNPMVEINLRTTMGLVARRLFYTFIDTGSKGIFQIERFENTETLLADHNKRKKENPLSIADGRIESGYLSLCPITEQTRYRASVEIEKAVIAD